MEKENDLENLPIIREKDINLTKEKLIMREEGKKKSKILRNIDKKIKSKSNNLSVNINTNISSNNINNNNKLQLNNLENEKEEQQKFQNSSNKNIINNNNSFSTIYENHKSSNKIKNRNIPMANRIEKENISLITKENISPRLDTENIYGDLNVPEFNKEIKWKLNFKENATFNLITNNSDNNNFNIYSNSNFKNNINNNPKGNISLNLKNNSINTKNSKNSNSNLNTTEKTKAYTNSISSIGKSQNYHANNNSSVSEFLMKSNNDNSFTIGYSNNNYNYSNPKNTSNNNGNVNGNTNQGQGYIGNINKSNICIPKGFSRVSNDSGHIKNFKLPIKLKDIHGNYLEEKKNFSKEKLKTINNSILSSYEAFQRNNLRTNQVKNKDKFIPLKVYNSYNNPITSNNEENLNAKNRNTMTNTNTTFENSNMSPKDIYLEKMYKQASIKNFRNLKEDLIEYFENYKDIDIIEEIEGLKNKYIFPNNSKFYLFYKNRSPKSLMSRISNLKNRVNAKNFEEKIAEICADNNIVNINQDGIQKIK